MTQQAVVLDLDGTLVDSVHHHVTAWHRALVAHGHDDVPMVRVHAGVGMGSDRLLPWLLGGPVDEDEFDAISDRHGELFRAVADDLRATRGAAALLDDLAQREVPHVIATSADPDERELLLRALGRQDLAVVDSGDVASSKPAPDLLLAACDHLDVDPRQAVMVGDSPWDAHAAARVDMPCVLVRCGGFGEPALREADPVRVVDAPADLIGQL
jgi:HAD superfamily hydrolase (TIGR01549 family)